MFHSIFLNPTQQHRCHCSLRAVLFPRHGQIPPRDPLSLLSLSLSLPLSFCAFLIPRAAPPVCVHIWCNWLFPFSLLHPREPAAVHISRVAPWLMADGQVMDWRKGTSVQSRSRAENHQAAAASLSPSPSLPLTDSLAPAPWRHPIHSSPRARPRGAAEAVSMETGFRRWCSADRPGTRVFFLGVAAGLRLGGGLRVRQPWVTGGEHTELLSHSTRHVTNGEEKSLNWPLMECYSRSHFVDTCSLTSEGINLTYTFTPPGSIYLRNVTRNVIVTTHVKDLALQASSCFGNLFYCVWMIVNIKWPLNPLFKWKLRVE